MSKVRKKEKFESSFMLILLIIGLFLAFFVIGIKLSEFTLGYGGVNIKCYDIPDEVKYGDNLIFKIQVSDTRGLESNKAKYSFVNLKIAPAYNEYNYVFKQYIWLKAGESKGLEVNIPFSAFQNDPDKRSYGIIVKADITLWEYSPLTGSQQLGFYAYGSTASSDAYNVYADYNFESASIKYRGSLKTGAGLGQVITTGITTKQTTTQQVVSIQPIITTTTKVTTTKQYSTYTESVRIEGTRVYVGDRLLRLSILEAEGVKISAGDNAFETNWIKWDIGFSSNLFETLKSSRSGKEEYIWQYGIKVGYGNDFGTYLEFPASVSVITNVKYAYKGVVKISGSCSHDGRSKIVTIPTVAGRYEISAPKEIVVNEGESPKTAEAKLKITNILSKPVTYYIQAGYEDIGSMTLNSGESKEMTIWSKTYSWENYMKDVDTYDNFGVGIKAVVDGNTIQMKDIGGAVHVVIKSYKPSAPSLPVITTTQTTRELSPEFGKLIYVDAPSQVYYDQPYSIVATVKNTGEKEGDIRISITLGSSLVGASEQVKRLKAGETFTFSKEDIVFKGTVGVTSKTWLITASIRDPANPNFWKTTDFKTITVNFVWKAGDIDYNLAEQNKGYLGTERISIASNIPINVLLDEKNVKSGDSIELAKVSHKLNAPEKVVYNGEIYELKEIKLNGNPIEYHSPAYFTGSGGLELVYERSVANNIVGGKTESVSGEIKDIVEVEAKPKIEYKEEVKDGETKQVLVDESPEKEVKMEALPPKPEFPIMNIILFAIIGVLLFGIIFLIIKIFKTKRRIR
jgi:hypothetical protein